MRQPVPFGKYILLDRVSVGGMAEVFKAKSFGVEGFEKVIAIKRILPSMGEDRDFIDMFIDEAKIAGQLAHANICQIFELGKIDGSHFIAMEYIWGKDLLQLQNRMRKQRQVMSLPMACFIVSKVCEGLDYAHRKRSPLGQAMNIVHRDCSPQNVLISYEGEVKLIDFGIAKAASRSSKTVAGVLKGKFGYMSPEQVRGLALDRRSDIFAVGTVLYECLTGERLFQCESDFSTLEKVRNVSIFPPSHFNRNIPQDLERIVMKALARNPEERYQYASELQADLQQVLMQQERVFTAKSLGTWMKEAFAVEVDRERSLMEQYKRVGRDGRAQPVTPVPEPAESLVSAPVARHATGGSRSQSSDFDDGPTEIFGELTIDEDPNSVAALVAAAKREAEPAAAHALGGPPAVAAQRPMPPPAPGALGGRAVSEDAAVAKVLVQERTPAPSAFGGDVLGPLAAGSSPGSTPEEISFGSTAAVAALPSGHTKVARRRSSLLKDVAIGLGIAALVLVIFAGAKILFFGEQPGTRAAEASSGTIAVTVPDNDPAEVHINGQQVGRVTGGEALQLGELAPGEYQVVVRRAGVPDCVRSVALNAKALEVVNCPFEKPAPKRSQLILRGSLADAVVFVDEQQVSAEAAREPMPLAPNVEHAVRVEREGLPTYEFSVRLLPGQQTTRVVPAEPMVAASKRRRGKREPRGFASFVAAEGKKLARDDKRDDTASDGGARKRPPREDADDKPAKDDSAKAAKSDATKDIAKRADADKAGADDASSSKATDKGYLVAWTTPWARVFIDGKDTGKMTPIAPRAKIALKPGKHSVAFVVGAEKFSYSVVIEPGQTVRLREKLPVKAE